jgi:hypothetical protein
MIKQIDGCSESDGRDFLGALATVQAVWWNSEELDKADWIMDSDTIGNFKQQVMAEGLPRLKGVPLRFAWVGVAGGGGGGGKGFCVIMLCL